MALLSNNILGHVSGSIAGLTFRRMNGKIFVASKRASYTTPTDTDSIQRRQNFGMACKLASRINSIDLLHRIWKSAAANHSTVFHTIVQSIYKTMESGMVTSHTMLAPGAEWNLCCLSSSWSDSQIDILVEVPAVPSKTDEPVAAAFTLIAVPIFTSPLEQTTDALLLDALVSEPLVITGSQPVNFILPLSPLLSQRYGHYRIHKGLFVLVALDTDDTQESIQTLRIFNLGLQIEDCRLEKPDH
jgi:hypothetical protein